MKTNISAVSGFLRAMTPVTPEFPRIEGDFLVIGPECFTLVDDPSVINWRGQNYVPQRPKLSVRWHNCKVAIREWWRWKMYGSRPDYTEHPLIAAFKELRGY